MIITLVGINSKYVHTNLAIRKLRAYVELHGEQVFVKEYSGNEELLRVAADILSTKTECVAFSCYIWNVEYLIKLADIIKKANPEIKIIFGGPEATYNYKEIFNKYSFIDMIIAGEGEKALLSVIKNGISEKLVFGEEEDLDKLPFPYTDEELNQGGRIFYYESSRGCPYSCSYCLSSAQNKVRYKQNIFEDLDKFASANVRLVKFVDRTFNSDLKRSKKILNYILNLKCDTQFHIELSADKIDEEFIEIVSKFPPNKLRVEAGLQSTNKETLKEIRRVCNLEKFSKNINDIINKTNVILHLDLIAGLPYENLSSFEKSFNYAFNLKPHELQLGFLKVLPGSLMAEQVEKHNILSSSTPPYEIISNSYISFKQLSRLKNLEAALDMYHNNGIIVKSESILIAKFKSPYCFYDSLAEFLKNEGLLSNPHHRIKLFDFLYKFATVNNLDTEEFKITLAMDYFLSCYGSPKPDWAEDFNIIINKEILRGLLSDNDILTKLPNLREIESKNRHKYIKVEKLFKMVWLVSNLDKKIVDITPYFLLDF